MTHIIRTMLALAAVAFFASCAAAPGRMTAPPPVPTAEDVVPDRRVDYVCDDGRRVQVTLMGAARARLNVGGAMTDLAAVRAASGAKYATPDGSIVFWSKGNTASIITRRPDHTLQCRVG